MERHERQAKRMETIVRESKPIELEGVVKSQSDNTKWDGLENLDVGSKFLMFEKREEEKSLQKMVKVILNFMDLAPKKQMKNTMED